MEDSVNQQRESWRQYDRQRRRLMSTEQREHYLARRRACYRARIERGKQVEMSCNSQISTHLSNSRTPQCANTSSTLPLQDITNNHLESRMRLTAVRQLARTTTQQQYNTG